MTSMADRSNCSKLHPEKVPGPCEIPDCGKYDVSKRYIHLENKISVLPDLCKFVKEKHSFLTDKSCICRKCFIRLQKSFEDKQKHNVDSHISSKKSKNESNDLCFLSKHKICNENVSHITKVDQDLFQTLFEFEHGNLFSEIGLCHRHYNKFNRYINESSTDPCIVCETDKQKRYVNIPDENKELFFRYLKCQLNSDTDEKFKQKPTCCYACYKSFYTFCRSDKGEFSVFQTDQCLKQCLSDYNLFIEKEKLSIDNIDLFAFQSILEKLVSLFLEEKVILLSTLYDNFKDGVQKIADANNFILNDYQFAKHTHDIRWLFRFLTVKLGKCLESYTPKNKKVGRLLYRNGTDILSSYISFIIFHEQETKRYTNEKNVLLKKNSALLSENRKLSGQDKILQNSISILRSHIKKYVSENISTCTNDLDDFDQFKYKEEVEKIPFILWNFICRLTATEREENVFKRFDLNTPILGDTCDLDICRALPRLYICSCLFNAFNSQCVRPLHLLLTDIFDKFSNSSSLFLSINARLGAGVSKDSLKRFISKKCVDLEGKQRSLVSSSFTVVSFDNLDKNTAYSVVGVGRDKSGFHGTTVQAVMPRPTIETEKSTTYGVTNNNNLDNNSCLHLDLDNSNQTSLSVRHSRDRSVPKLLVEKAYSSEIYFEPSNSRPNKFSCLSIDDFHVSEKELTDWNLFSSELCRYGFAKSIFQQLNIALPGVKTFFALPLQHTEVSKLTPISILDETADKKETVIKILNNLFEKFNVGVSTDYVVVVGDGKSYDLLIKIKAEYGDSLQWVLPYPGDWHILKNLLPVFIKIYFDAGLKEIATICHRGSTLRSLLEGNMWSLTHRFFVHVWEAMMRHQVKCFILSLSEDEVDSIEMNFSKKVADILTGLDINFNQEEQLCNASFTEEICSKKAEIFEIFSPDLLIAFSEWRKKECEKSDTFSLWDQFLHVDFMSYLGFYFGIRSRNWSLRNASLKQLACLFHAFDRHNYLRMIPHHLADILTFPDEVISFFEQGCFAVSFSGEDFYSVGLDEAHEMGINLRTKNAMNCFSQPSLTSLTYYLPYRAESLHNFKKEIGLERDDQHHREKTVSYISTEENTITEYISKFQTSSLFTADDKKTLHHIFTGVDATTEQTDSLMNYRQYGQEDMDNYLKCYLLKVSDTLAKVPSRKRRNLKTFSAPKVTVSKQKKEIKDQKTVISCLRKKIAFSKINNQPVSDLDQFLQLPRAICDADGVPEKGQKSSATTILKTWYTDSFSPNIHPLSSESGISYIIDGMFIINSIPLQSHRLFSEYASFLFNRWVYEPYKQFKATEVHILFDDPIVDGPSPKDIERARRDKTSQDTVFNDTHIDIDTVLPSNWSSFISVRKHKRLLINFLSDYFLTLACQKFQNSECFFVTAGGFDHERKDMAFCAVGSTVAEYLNGSGCHEEADTRVWLHAAVSSARTVLIYSPDTDVIFIGLPLVKDMQKQIFLHLKYSNYESLYLDMNKLSDNISSDLNFQGIENAEQCLQMLYIISGCDFVSFFRGYGKKTFFEVFKKNASFITGGQCIGHLPDVSSELGLYSFYRLVISVYFYRYLSAFQPLSSPKALIESVSLDNVDLESCYSKVIMTVREKQWERVVSEADMIPTKEALYFHWKRCLWVFIYWSKSTINFPQLPSLTDYGWHISDNKVSIIWDSESNFKKVEKNVEWYTKGCGCQSGRCSNNRCRCKKNGSVCGPACKCQNCKNLSVVNINADISYDDLSFFNQADSDSNFEDEEEVDRDVDSEPENEVENNRYWTVFEDDEL